MSLAGWKRVGVIAFEVVGNCFIQLMLLFRRFEWPGDELAFGVTNVLLHLTAECAPTEAFQAVTQTIQVPAVVDVLRAEGGEVTEEAVINQRGEAIEFKQRVLQRRGGDEKCFAVFNGPTNLLPDSIALAVSVSEFVGLINNHKMPGNGPDVIGVPTGVMQGADNNGYSPERVRIATLFRLPICLGVEDRGWEMELFFQFHRPLLAEGRRANDKHRAPLFGPVLADYQASLNRLAQADFISQQDAL